MAIGSAVSTSAPAITHWISRLTRSGLIRILAFPGGVTFERDARSASAELGMLLEDVFVAVDSATGHLMEERGSTRVDRSRGIAVFVPAIFPDPAVAPQASLVIDR